VNTIKHYFFIAILLFLGAFVSTTMAQSISLLIPVRSPFDEQLRAGVQKELSPDFRVVDSAIGDTVFDPSVYPTPFNLTNSEAQNLGKAIGSSYLVLFRSEVINRNTFEKGSYFEASLAAFLIDTRSGRRIKFVFSKHDSGSAATSKKLLLNDVGKIGTKIKSILVKHWKVRTSVSLGQESDLPSGEYRSPLPFQRLKPSYTDLASSFRIAATVDIEVEIGADGKIIDTNIVRWAGYGLEQSVEKTVREMNWRPADKKGKPFAMKVLLRYNFRDLENPE